MEESTMLDPYYVEHPQTGSSSRRIARIEIFYWIWYQAPLTCPNVRLMRNAGSRNWCGNDNPVAASRFVLRAAYAVLAMATCLFASCTKRYTPNRGFGSPLPQRLT